MPPPPELALKVAVAFSVEAPAVKAQVLEVPVQAPLQPPKVLPVAAVAVRVMAVVEEKLVEAVEQPTAAQLRPAGLLLMLPLPLPVLVTVTKRDVEAAVNTALT